MGRGEFSARKLKNKRKKMKWKDVHYMKRSLDLKRKEPLGHSPQGRGIVIDKRNCEQKQPHSGLIKTVRVQLVKNNIQITAFIPGNKAIDKISEHDEVTIEGMGGSQGGPIGSQWGLKYRVVKVNGIALSEIVSGKKQKPMR